MKSEDLPRSYRSTHFVRGFELRPRDLIKVSILAVGVDSWTPESDSGSDGQMALY